jgi:hypothetical protein
MADAVRIDASQLRTLAKALGDGAERVEREHRQVVSRGGLNIKDQLRAEMGGSTHFKGIVPAISMQLTGNRSYSEAEVGPDSDAGSPGNLANIAYFGGARGGGTVPDPRGALEAEIPGFERALLDLAGDVLA